MKRRLILATLISSFALCSCGIKGDLKRPAPLWGEDKRTEAEKAEQTKANAPEITESNGRQSIRIEAPEPVETPLENPGG